MNGVDFPVDRVLDGIATAVRAGLAPVKINMVVRRGVNEASIIPVARWAREEGLILRFIEFMDVGHTNGWRMDEVVPQAEILARIDAEMPLEALPATYAGEVAGRFRYRDGSGEVGVIASVTQPFCGACTRARLSAEGRALHVPVRCERHGPQDTAARRGHGRRARRADPRHVDDPRGSLLGAARGGHGPRTEGRDVRDRRLRRPWRSRRGRRAAVAPRRRVLPRWRHPRPRLGRLRRRPRRRLRPAHRPGPRGRADRRRRHRRPAAVALELALTLAHRRGVLRRAAGSAGGRTPGQRACGWPSAPPRPRPDRRPDPPRQPRRSPTRTGAGRRRHHPLGRPPAAADLCRRRSASAGALSARRRGGDHARLDAAPPPLRRGRSAAPGLDDRVARSSCSPRAAAPDATNRELTRAQLPSGAARAAAGGPVRHAVVHEFSTPFRNPWTQEWSRPAHSWTTRLSPAGGAAMMCPARRGRESRDHGDHINEVR